MTHRPLGKNRLNSPLTGHQVLNPLHLVSDEDVRGLLGGAAVVELFGVQGADVTKGDLGDAFGFFEGDVVVEG